TPIGLTSLEGGVPASSFNDAIDASLSEGIEMASKQAQLAKPKEDKFHIIVRKQQAQIDGLEKSASENQRKGELLYERYQEVQALLAEIVKLRKAKGWPAVKAKFKNHELIRQIDEKTGHITLEI
ncbi:MAG: hypothetical protein ABIH41_02655, partial [Nanoarchaeota archaeon]